MTVLTFGCLRCGAAYQQVRRRASHFCPACRATRRRECEAERSRRNREAARNVRAMVAAGIVDGEINANDAAVSVHPTLAQYDDAHEGDERTLVPDRMPANANSAFGPDEGMSVARGSELAGAIYGRDGLAMRAAAHLWWQANTHWSYELHDPDAAAEHLQLRSA